MVLNLKDFPIGSTIQNEKDKSVWIVVESKPINQYKLELFNLKSHESKEFIVAENEPITWRTGDSGDVSKSFREIDKETLEHTILSESEYQTLLSLKQNLVNKRDVTLNEILK